jgi:hypothetical protein
MALEHLQRYGTKRITSLCEIVWMVTSVGTVKPHRKATVAGATSGQRHTGRTVGSARRLTMDVDALQLLVLGLAGSVVAVEDEVRNLRFHLAVFIAEPGDCPSH